MAYECFINYTRANNDPYLKRFVRDLDEYLRGRRGLASETPACFFDQQNIELGADWDHTIASALAEARSVVTIASPALFKSEYCGRERELFRRRFPPGGNAPPLIKPIIWIPFSDIELPPTFAADQFTFGDPAAVYNTKGMKYILKRHLHYRDPYHELIADLGEALIKAAAEHPLPPLVPVPALADVPSEWGPGSGRVVQATITGPKHVRFIYLAFDPNSIGGARSVEPYRDEGGVDWKPYYPDPTPIHLFAQQVVTAGDLAFTSDAVPFAGNLLDEITRAWSARQIVVIVLDPWSLSWDLQTLRRGYQALLNTLDRQNAFHWCVLLPWNDQDPYLAENRLTIEGVIAQTFPFHGGLTKNPMFYRDGIRSFAELKTALTEVLARLREEIRRQAEVTMPLPIGPSKVVMQSPTAARP